LLRCYYNFIRPHKALKLGRETRTPAMQAALTPRRLTFREVFMSPTSCLSSETIPFVVTDPAMPIRIAAAPMPLAA
jgi:hypothetical protein